MGYYGFYLITSIPNNLLKNCIDHRTKKKQLSYIEVTIYECQINYKPGSVVKTYHLSRL